LHKAGKHYPFVELCPKFKKNVNNKIKVNFNMLGYPVFIFQQNIWYKYGFSLRYLTENIILFFNSM